MQLTENGVPKTILVIEDHPLVRDAIIELLSAQHFNVLVAVNGSDGIELAKKHHPDLVISNYCLPVADGKEVLERLREDENTADIPFIIVSEDPSVSLESSWIRLGADAYIDKVGDVSRLYEVVPQLLRQVEHVRK